jgi:cyclase
MEIEQLGAGEILLTSVDKEGTGEGLDKELIRKVSSVINIPLVVHGGTGQSEHVLDVKKESKISGVSIASLLHYHFIKTNRRVDGFEAEGNIEFLKSNRLFNRINTMALPDLKNALSSEKINCRLD